MKEQFQALCQFKYDEGTDKWCNVVYLLSNCEKRFADTLEEAQMWIDKAIQRGIDRSKHSQTQSIKGIGITTEANDGLLVVKTKIKKRKVTEWEEV